MKRTNKNRYTNLGKSYNDKIFVQKCDNVNTIITIVLSLIAIMSYFLPCMRCNYDSSDLQGVSGILTSATANSFKAIGTITSCYDIWQTCLYVYATLFTLVSLSVTLIIGIIKKVTKKSILTKSFNIFKYVTAALGIVYIVSIILSTTSSSGSFTMNYYEYLSIIYSVDYGAIIICVCCIGIGILSIINNVVKNKKVSTNFIKNNVKK